MNPAAVKLAWLEWVVSHQTATGNGECIPKFIEVPGWFRAGELGLAIDAGPSIVWTHDHLEQINRAHTKIFEAKQHPQPKPSSEQDEAEQRRRQWRSWLRMRQVERQAKRDRKARSSAGRKRARAA